MFLLSWTYALYDLAYVLEYPIVYVHYLLKLLPFHFLIRKYVLEHEWNQYLHYLYLYALQQ